MGLQQPPGAPLVQVVHGVAGCAERDLHDECLEVAVDEALEVALVRVLGEPLDPDRDHLALDLPDEFLGRPA
jgi:hypothetical protein